MSELYQMVIEDMQRRIISQGTWVIIEGMRLLKKC